MYLMCKLIFVQVKITHTIFVFLFKKKPTKPWGLQIFLKKVLIFYSQISSECGVCSLQPNQEEDR